MLREGASQEMLSPREHAERASQESAKAEQAALDKANLPTKTRNRVALALGLASAMAMGMVTGESRAMSSMERQADPTEATTESDAEKMVAENKRRDEVDHLAAKELKGEGYVEIITFSEDSTSIDGGEGEGSASAMGNTDHNAWLGKHLAISAASGTISSELREGKKVTTEFDRNTSMKVYEVTAAKTIVDTGRLITVEGEGTSEAEAVQHALAEAAAVSKSATRNENFRSEGKDVSRTVHISITETETYFEGVQVLEVVAPKAEGEMYTVKLKAKEAKAI